MQMRIARAGKRPHHALNDRIIVLVMVVLTLLILGVVALLDLAAARVAAPAEATMSVDPATLLPLAAPVNPLAGGHDMSGLPDPSQIHARPLPASAPQPNVDLPLMRWDWGTIPAKPAVAQTFPIQNRGTETLIVRGVATSCGCTTASLSSSVIPPGERADLRVVFDPSFHNTVGPVMRLIWLQTNDPDLPLVEIQLDANVMP